MLVWRLTNDTREAAIKRYTDAGGTWPPKMARMTLWRGTGDTSRCRVVAAVASATRAALV